MTVTVCNRQRLCKIDSRLLKKIAVHVLRLVGANDRQQLNIVLVDDAGIAPLNKQFHHTDGPTDILSFDYGGGVGELIISVEHAFTQAKRFKSTPSRELALYLIHGILHLNGYNDLAPRERSRMRAAERRLMAGISATDDLTSLVSLPRGKAD